MRNHVFLIGSVCLLALAGILSFGPGCVPHAEERAENALVAGQYQIALERCVDKAIASLADGGDRDVAGDIYVACAEKADAVSGRKK